MDVLHAVTMPTFAGVFAIKKQTCGTCQRRGDLSLDITCNSRISSFAMPDSPPLT